MDSEQLTQKSQARGRAKEKVIASVRGRGRGKRRGGTRGRRRGNANDTRSNSSRNTNNGGHQALSSQDSQIGNKRQRESGGRRRRISFNSRKDAQFQDPPTKKVKKSRNECISERINVLNDHGVHAFIFFFLFVTQKIIHSIIKEKVMMI